MRRYFILTVLCFSSLLASSQQLTLAKASPFTAVRWEKEQPIVQFENEWYEFEKIDGLSKEVILNFCKKQYGSKWQKRFAEDLVEVLTALGHQPDVKVSLQLSKNGISSIYTGTFTSENRNKLLLYNKSIDGATSILITSQTISIAEAMADLTQFEEILKSTSSYSQLSALDYQLAIKTISNTLVRQNKEVDVNELTHELAKIMAEIGDRHSSIKNEAFNKRNHKTYNLKLPFGLATLNGKIIGLKKDTKGEDYEYYDRAYPFIKSIDGMAIEKLISTYNYRDKMAPEQARLTRGANAVQKYGALLFENNIACADSVTVVFSKGHPKSPQDEKAVTFQLTAANNSYVSKLLQVHDVNNNEISKLNFEGLGKKLPSNIGYINIPEMYNYEEVKGLESAIEDVLKRFSNTKALIIDIRNNPGGGREILQTFARYIVQPKQSPWVANVAYLRTDKYIIGDEDSMSGRYLYSYNSEQLSAIDRQAIDQFNKIFKLQKPVDETKFSNPFYMVLHSGKVSYSKPVYILVNEESFSAASVFASAFKGLPNVKIVGVTTDGSSGNSKVMYLKNSNIKVSVSTMLSFQRNGKILDGNGTVPDIVMNADEEQVLNRIDSQLDRFIEKAKSSKTRD